MRKTNATVRVAVALMEDPRGKHWGYDLGKKSGVRSGVLYPMLTRMLDEGWLSDGWQDPAETKGKPPRRYYQITSLGLARLGAMLAEAQTDHRFAGAKWWPAHGH